MASRSRPPAPPSRCSHLAIAVAYGDIGTSPLHAFREALAQTADGGIGYRLPG